MRDHMRNISPPFRFVECAEKETHLAFYSSWNLRANIQQQEPEISLRYTITWVGLKC
jgi:hypothetical protein